MTDMFGPGDTVTNGFLEFEVVYYHPDGTLVGWLHGRGYRKGSKRKATFNPEYQKTLKLVSRKAR